MPARRPNWSYNASEPEETRDNYWEVADIIYNEFMYRPDDDEPELEEVTENIINQMEQELAATGQNVNDILYHNGVIDLDYVRDWLETNRPFPNADITDYLD